MTTNRSPSHLTQILFCQDILSFVLYSYILSLLLIFSHKKLNTILSCLMKLSVSLFICLMSSPSRVWRRHPEARYAKHKNAPLMMSPARLLSVYSTLFMDSFRIRRGRHQDRHCCRHDRDHDQGHDHQNRRSHRQDHRRNHRQHRQSFHKSV